MSVSFHCCSIFTHSSFWGMDSGAFTGCTMVTVSAAIIITLYQNVKREEGCNSGKRLP
jgi:hypothetical protein